MSTPYKAAFIRGGTSKALVFHLRDLPSDRAAWDAVFLSAMGSPDRYGRQLDGMGGGVSSLSKVCVVGPPTVDGADVDYTFVQVLVKEAHCDYSGNCGNMSSAIGPFAVDEGLVERPAGTQARVRIHNTNTRKIIEATFPVEHGRSLEAGGLAIPGVDGTGAPIRLDFLDPGGATTGTLLPTGMACAHLEVEGVGMVETSMVDAANACVFVRAGDVGLRGDELPDELEANAEAMRKLGAIRLAGSVAMGIAGTLEEARAKSLVPFIAIVSETRDSLTLSGERIGSADADLLVRMLSNGQPHRALPLTASLCTAVAAKIGGTIPQRLLAPGHQGAIRLAMPSGVLTVDAEVTDGADGTAAKRGAFFRTCRRLFDGQVYA